jgi:hypothetical protein
MNRSIPLIDLLDPFPRSGCLRLAAMGACWTVALYCVGPLSPAPARADLSDDIQQLLEANTDGTVGLYLKEVNGPVLANFNETFVTYPASTIKVLEHLHAMRAVESGVDLDLTMLTVCRDCGTCASCTACTPPGVCTGDVNCSDQSNAVDGCTATTESLRCSLQRMMFVSSNQSTNAVQEIFGGGIPSAGRTAMNLTATDVVGTSVNTALEHKLACGNVSNNPFNTMTLEDMGLLYEEVATNPAVLMNPAQFYSLMLNETVGSLDNAIDSVVNGEAALLGMDAADPDVVAFKSGFLLAYKAGNIPAANPGNNRYQSMAGWADFPFSCNEPDRQYVYGYMIDNATTTTIGGNTVVSELLREEVADAMSSVLCERPPELSIPAPLTVECSEAGGVSGNDAQIEAWLDQAVATDACDAVDTSDDAPAFFPVDCPVAGASTAVEFTTTSDSCGNSVSDSSSVTVEDTTAPVLEGVPADATVECDAVPGPPEVSAGDVCAGPLAVAFGEEETAGECPGNYTLERTWSASDTCSNEAVEEQTLTVEDTTPPDVASSAEDLHCLWPPNHKYVCFGMDDFAPQLTDNCSEPIAWAFAGCSSDQPDDANGGGDGHTTEDCLVADDGDSFCVRAERGASGAGAKAGRRYSVSVVATDACGNASNPVAIGSVHVPFKGEGAGSCISAN